MYNMHHLYYFYVTAKMGGVTKAAQFLHIAQSALSTQLRTLESSLGTKLFERSGRTIRLSREAKSIFGYCQRIFESYSEFEDFMKKGHTVQRSKMTIAISEELENSFFADIVTSMHASLKHVHQPRFRLLTMEHKRMVENLQSCEIDAAISNYEPLDKSLKIQAQISFPIYMCIGREYLLGKPALKLKAQSESVGLVLPRNGYRLREEIDHFLIKEKFPNPVVFESDIMEATKRAVVNGLGIGFFPSLYVDEDLKARTLVRIGGREDLWSSSIFLISPAADSEREWLRTLRPKFLKLKGVSERQFTSYKEFQNLFENWNESSKALPI